jgi:hypothetical protein
MEQLDTYTPQEQEQLGKHKQLKPARQLPRKRKSSLAGTIATSGRQLRAIRTQQRLMRLRRLLEIEELLQKELNRVSD